MPDDNNAKSEILNIMKDLQPVAFLISISLVIATFYEKNDSVHTVYLTYILVASLYFFFAYIGLFFFIKTNFPLFRYYGEVSLLFAAMSIFRSFPGIVQIICKAITGNDTTGNANISDFNGLLISIFILSFFLISVTYLLGKVKKGKLYSWYKIFFYSSFILFCFFILLSLFEIISGTQNYRLTIIILIATKLLWFLISISLLPLTFFYYYEKPISPEILDLRTKLKNEDIFSNPIELLKTVAIPLIGFCLLATLAFIYH